MECTVNQFYNSSQEIKPRARMLPHTYFEDRSVGLSLWAFGSPKYDFRLERWFAQDTQGDDGHSFQFDCPRRHAVCHTGDV